jgi:DNA-binding MarR family transcriptional regulator
MDKKEIRAFRRDLRSFSRILSQQVGICCCCDVTPAQCHVLLALEESGPLPNRELAALLQVDASTLSRTIDQLARKDLVERQPHPDDRRATLLELSDQGNQVATSIHATADSLYRSILGEIPVEHRLDVLKRFAQLVETFRRWQDQGDG